MISREMRARVNNAREKLAERADREADPDYQDIKAQRQRYADEQEAQARATREAERLQREGPARAVALLLIERIGDDLPEVMASLSKLGGMAKVTGFLEAEATRLLDARREAERAATAASLAELSADMLDRARARQDVELDRRLDARTAETEAA